MGGGTGEAKKHKWEPFGGIVPISLLKLKAPQCQVTVIVAGYMLVRRHSCNLRLLDNTCYSIIFKLSIRYPEEYLPGRSIFQAISVFVFRRKVQQAMKMSWEMIPFFSSSFCNVNRSCCCRAIRFSFGMNVTVYP
jgi:hypothetical protein